MQPGRNISPPPRAPEGPWKASIFFSTTCKVLEGAVDKLGIHIRYPFSDLRQKIKLTLSTPEASKREFISQGSYELCTFNIMLDTADTEIINRFNIELAAKTYPVSPAAFPPPIEHEAARHYLQATPLVEANDPEIIEIGQNVTALCKKSTDAIMRITRFITTNVKFDPEPMDNRQSAKELLRTKIGRCQDINHLFSALCRAVKIPARMVLGFVNGKNGWARHAWSDVYDPQFGWFPIDIATEHPSAGALDAMHLKLMTGLDSSEPEIQVTYDIPSKKVYPVISMKHTLFIEKSAIKTIFTIKQDNQQPGNT